mmetsp:Transcript_18594/g.51926  ORF Transcript_18594/g.51926 Transcript_18594/m.51926 type:complete len:347 (-) Transcript_18594:186-1226(-)
MAAHGLWVRFALLSVLTLQNTGQAVLIKLAQIQGSHPDSLVVMLFAELVKVVGSILLFFLIEADNSWARHFYPSSLKGSIKLLPTALLFAVQNQLLFEALHNLDPAVYQALSQLKILWAGVFSVILLGKSLSQIQWVALVLLACGASLVQLESGMCGGKGSVVAGDPVRGFVAVVIACVTSGLAGCYTELMLKTHRMPMWLQSAQVALASAFILSVTLQSKRWLAASDAGGAPPRELTDGFIPLTWGVVAIISLGGLTVVAVLRYADNLLKGISMVFSLLLSGFVSLLMFQTEIGIVFCVAAVVICCSVFLYQASPTTVSAIDDREGRPSGKVRASPVMGGNKDAA